MFLNIPQNTPEWLELRKGKITGSSVSKIMANNPKAFGDPAKKLAVDIALNYSEPGYKNAHMERGHIQEIEARKLYEEENFVTVLNGGFFDNDLTGCSPDGLVGEDGLIEIKSVIPSVQYKTLQRNTFDPAYKWQIFFNLKETGRQWIDYISYCANFPIGNQLIIHRVYAKDCTETFKQIDTRIAEFKDLIDEVNINILRAA